MLQLLFGMLLFTVASNGAKDSPTTNFSCESRPSGYYADMETGCQIYHMCDGLGRQFSYSCPNATLFQQRMLICDHWYMVNCSKSETDYSANLLIGQRDKPFLEDSENNPYHRTPRPDLLANSNAPDYNSLYRNGRSQFKSNLNLVGVETDNENNSSNRATNQPSYSLPSHWFTEYSESTTAHPSKEKSSNSKPDKIPRNTENNNKKILVDNHKPKLKPSLSQTRKFSDFQKKIDIAQQNFVERGHPSRSSTDYTSIRNDLQKSHMSNVVPNKIKPPSVFYQPPDIESSHTLNNKSSLSSLSVNADFKVSATTKKPFYQGTEPEEKRWKDLRNFFLIPDYEFPLDPISRPGYENGQNSFQVKPSNSQKK